MGSGSSKPPPQRTSVRAYPGSQGRPVTPPTGGTHFKTPRSGTPSSVPGGVAEEPSGDPATETKYETASVDEPTVLTEEQLIAKANEERDVIIDDGESVIGKKNPEVIVKKKNEQRTEMGREVQTLDCRASTEGEEKETPGRPQADGGLWTDPEFTKDVAMSGMKDDFKWQRPKDFMKAPCLYGDGTSRYDIEQGAAGTCWFLSVLSAMGDKQDYLSWIIPEDSYRVGTDSYDGIFHCRFWCFGEWVDVYVDDYLPVLHDKPWGARSKTDPNELWVSLIEKAFAKFVGSYEKCSGGMASKSFSSLTAGTSEVFNVDEVQPKDIYRRAKNALNCGSIIAASVHNSGTLMGLTGNHSYTVTGVCKVTYRSKFLPLVRIRNPWGGREGEWTGAWSDKSTTWSELSPTDKQAIDNNAKADGEFWMSLTDFFQYFSNLTICNFTPDVDQDGKTDGLDNVCVMFGEWVGESAVGLEQSARMKNPKFLFEIPQQGVPKGGTPVCIELIQKLKWIKDQELLNIRADLYKIEAVTGSAEAPGRLIRQLTNVKLFYGGWSMMYRYPALEAGSYLLVPNYYQPAGTERQFLLRTFSQVKLNCQQVTETTGYFEADLAPSFEHEGKQHQTPDVAQQFGEWKPGHNAGGQISHKRTVATNPQYAFSIRGQLAVPNQCVISLSQDMTQPRVPIGFRLFKREKKYDPPVTMAWLYNNYELAPVSIDGKQSRLISGPEAQMTYMLPVGDYILLVHTDKPDQANRYCLQVATKQKITLKAFNQ